MVLELLHRPFSPPLLLHQHRTHICGEPRWSLCSSGYGHDSYFSTTNKSRVGREGRRWERASFSQKKPKGAAGSTVKAGESGKATSGSGNDGASQSAESGSEGSSDGSEENGNHQVWREKNVIKPTPGKRHCNCRNEVYHRQIGLGMFQQMTEQVCEQCNNVKYEREGYFITVDIEKGMQDGQEVVFYEDGEPIIDGEPGDLKVSALTLPPWFI
ncbi:dnaJ protein ERDJ3B-like [Rosa rugosa]|uniref:dnaJ protein ERDJ3B-like n=1 Tax=Rosa rugosa TaxID=74645 RepID=UPI002B413FB8|nr:dnaJ protein ERDJ3B-like [Rosa rugosa]